MNNKRVLQIATKELNKRKAPPAPKDIIVDPAGQWKYPGQVTRIPSNTITMQGVPYPVMGVPNKGEPTMMQPGQYYEFPDADYVDEYPQMKKGGGLKSKKYTRSLEGIGEVFRESALFKKSKSKKKKFFNPNAKYFQDGGSPYMTQLTPEEEIKFQTFYKTLPENLQSDDPSYDIRGYWDSEGRPTEFDYSQPKQDDGYYHAYSLNSNTGKYLKAPWHPTFQKAVDTDRSLGWRPTVNVNGEVISTDNPDIIEEERSFLNNTEGPSTGQYQDGGITTQEEIDAANNAMMKARLAYAYMHGNPAAQRMVVAPDQPYDFGDGNTGTHYMASMDEYAVPLIQDVNGQLMLGDFGPESAEAMRFDNLEDAMYFADHYKQITPDESYRKEYPEEDYIEADLTPEEIQEYAKGGYVIEELDGYAEGGDPGDVQCPPGYVYNPETKYCERKSGCPEGYTFDAKSGRCVSNYQKESIKVMAAPYKYRENGSAIDFPNEYEDSEFKPISEDQLVYSKSAQKSTWPKDFYVKDVSNPIYFKNSGVVHISTPEFVPEFEGDHEYYISTYPDLNYKVVVDSKKPEGFNKDENIYYVKSENTHQFKKYKEWEKLKALEKENLENAKKYGFTLDADPPSYSQKYPDEYYKTSLNKYDEDGEKIWDYEEGNYEYKPGWDDKKYRADHKTVQELYNDPEYLGWDAYDKSFDEIFKDRGTKNIETYKERCPDCTYFHGQRMSVDPDYMYDSYNPFQNKVAEGQMTRAFKTLEPDYADPNIDKQMPTLEEYGYPDMPGYNPASYKGKGIHPTYGYDKKARTHIGMHPGKRDSFKDKFYVHTTWDDDKDFRGFGTHDRTKLLPFIVQKSTGYNPEGMEGYYDEENNWVPGEYEKAAEEGRKINFQGAASVRDLRNQKEYQLKYEQYLKEKADIDNMNKELRQEWLPEPEVASQYARGGAVCPPGYIKVAGKCVPAGSATAEDSLAVYRNALEQKRYYDSLKAYYQKPQVDGWYYDPNDVKIFQDEHLDYTVSLAYPEQKKKMAEVKKKIKSNKDPNIYQILDLITGALDANAPLLRYDKRITPQGQITYMPSSQYELSEGAKEQIKKLPKNLVTKYFSEISQAIGQMPYKEYVTVAKKYKIPEKYVKEAYKKQKRYTRLLGKLPGHITTLPYYDPIAVKPSNLLSDEEVIERFKKYGKSGISESRLKRLKLTPDAKKETKPQYKEAVKKKPAEHKYPTSYLPVVDNTPKVTPEGKVQVGTEKVMVLDPKTGKVTTVITPVYEELESKRPTPTPTYVNPELQKFVEEKKPEPPGPPPGPPPGTGTDVMPVYYTDELPEYATPDPDAEWVNQTERYIDWNANRIPYRLPKFRKPGHGGDLIKPGKRRYIPIPGIETRNSAYIQREDEEYRDGGEPKKKKNKNVKPFVTSDPEEYAYRKAAYDDSSHLAKKYNAREPRANRAMTYHGVTGSHTGRPKRFERGYTPNHSLFATNMNYAEASPAWKNFIYGNPDRSHRYAIRNAPIGYKWERSFFDTHAAASPFGVKTFTLPGEKEMDYLDIKFRFQPPVQPVKFVSPDDKKKNTSSKHLIKKPVPKVTEEPLPPVVVQEKPVIPIPPGPPPGIPPTPPIPVPPTGYPGIMPVYDTDELPMYATPDPNAEWVGDTKRYIDWDGNSVGYNLPRVRKPGHGGDLIRKGKRRYLHFPSIESRYEAEIVPEEEYAMGGEYTIGDEVELSEAEVQRLRSLGYIIEEA